MKFSVDRPRPITAAPFDIGVLEQYFQSQSIGITRILGIEQFGGGFSNLTFCLHTDAGDRILRHAPHSAHIKSAHDMEREFRVLSTLRPYYSAVPRPLLFCADSSIIGMPYYLMEKMEGVILRGKDARTLAGCEPALLHDLCETFVKSLAALHHIDIQATNLIQLGKPEGYVQRQTQGWIERYHRAHTDDCADARALEHWLLEHQPSAQSPTLLHNDYKFDNLVLDPEDLTKLRAVLDWEMATVGDPLMDFGAALAYWVEPGDDDFCKAFNFTWLPGCMSRRELASRYAEITGCDLSHLSYYYAFGLYKNAVILQQIYARWKAGTAPDPRFAALGPGARVLIAMAKRASQDKLSA